jgi:hypothetical protein
MSAAVENCPLCKGAAEDLSTSAVEHVRCTECGLSLMTPFALEAWNDRKPTLTDDEIRAIAERIAAKHGLEHEPRYEPALVDFGRSVSAAVVPDEFSQSLAVGVGLYVHGGRDAIDALRARLDEPESQVSDALKVIQAAERAGFRFEGGKYVADLPSIVRLLKESTP